MERLRVLVVAPRVLHPATRGDQRRALGLVERLREHAEITVLAFGQGAELPFGGVRSVAVHRSAARSLAGNARALTDLRTPAQVRLYLDGAMAAAVRREVAALRPDVVHVSLARMAPYLALADGAHRHLDLVDSLGLNMRRRAERSRPPVRALLGLEARLLERYEARVAATADSVSLVSATDRRDARGLARAAVVPNGVDAREFEFRSPSARPPRLLFFGNLGYFHNVEPARFLAEEVLPRLRAEIPGVVLRIAGARPARAVRRLAALPGVELRPDVPDIVAELHSAAVAVLPSFSGTGMKNKVLEAFSAGLPVVANRAGTDGVDGSEPGREYALADTPEEFTAACSALLGDAAERVRLAEHARALVEARYTWERSAEQLLRLYGGDAART